MGPLETRLERGAKKVGWRLRWRSAPLPFHPRQTQTELDIIGRDGKLVNLDPIWSIHMARGEADNGIAQAREKLAGVVLAALPRRGAQANR